MVRARINSKFFLLPTYCIHYGFLKVLFYLHYKVSSLGHFLVRSMRFAIPCISRAFRHTFNVGYPRGYGFHLHSHFFCCAILHTFSHVLSHAFPSMFIHPFLARSPKDSLPLSHDVPFLFLRALSRPLGSFSTSCVPGIAVFFRVRYEFLVRSLL